MGFVEIEAVGKRVLEQFPVIKHTAKRIYQGISVAASRDKVRNVGDIVCVSPKDDYEYFYGYYDKSPWDATDRYMICLRVQQAYKSVAPKEPGTVCLIDTANSNALIEIGMTHSWNVQQGCMAQWLGPDFKSRIIYNDFRDNKYCSVIYNVENMKEEKVLPLPVYDVSRDGAFALTLDFNRLHRMRPGYGYSNLPDSTKRERCPDKCCIWKMDISSGKVTELFKYTDFAAFEPDGTMNGAEHKVNHLMISPNGKRFMVLHRWFQKGRKHTRLVTANVDKSEMYNLSDDVFVSHCYWKNDNEILSFLRKKETGNHYYLMKDKTQEYKMLWPELNTDGHCSYSPNGKFIVTDTYPNRKRIASVYLCTEEDNRSRRIAHVFSPFKYDNDCRCDLHPRWNRVGNKICFDSVHDGKKRLYTVSIRNIINKLHFCYNENQCDDNVLVSFITPAFNAEKTIDKCIHSVVEQTCSQWEIVIIDDGSTDKTKEKLEKYKSDPRIKILSQENTGPGNARNVGIKEASGKYICFLDADDYIDANFVEKAKEMIRTTDADVLYYETYYEDESGKELKTSKIYLFSDSDKYSFIVRQMSGAFSWGACKLLKSKLIKESGAKFSGQDVGEEALFTFMALKAAQRIEFIKTPLYHYVQSDFGQHKKGDTDPIGNTIKMMKSYLQKENLLDQYGVALNNMAVKGLSMSLYRLSISNKFLRNRRSMVAKIKEYESSYDFNNIDQGKLNISARMLLPFIKCRVLFPVYIASKIRKNNKLHN